MQESTLKAQRSTSFLWYEYLTIEVKQSRTKLIFINLLGVKVIPFLAFSVIVCLYDFKLFVRHNLSVQRTMVIRKTNKVKPKANKFFLNNNSLSRKVVVS